MIENSPETEKKKSDNNILTDAPELTVETANQILTANHWLIFASIALLFILAGVIYPSFQD